MPTEKLLQLLKEITEEKIPFNKLIGMKIETLDLDKIGIRFKMRPELVGNFTRGNLHGGVISSVLDVTGGMVAWTGIMKKMEGQSFDEISERFNKIGTIDIRVDYLRPGLGEYFIATGSTLRTGNKVSVTRMELHNDKGILIAVGTGTYVVG
ncbi:MAG: thioesterase family protein [SAR324 cluster bacterium]|uniref:Thioesterase family protein n=1 Tax=SAR324 cluster bacterium TaxID=2024889 RepID=A0A432G790_9DELT|nr:MAG: thioesterase family protein [SAR324 cluster bacterium]